MKGLYRFSLAVLVGLLFTGCELLGSEEEELDCGDKNAVATIGVNEDTRCATARAEIRSYGTADERMIIGIKWNTGAVDLILNPGEQITAKTYTMDSGSSFWHVNYNRGDAAMIEITEIDRENNTISGNYSVAGEGNSNYQAYDYKNRGTFTKASIRTP